MKINGGSGYDNKLVMFRVPSERPSLSGRRARGEANAALRRPPRASRLEMGRWAGRETRDDWIRRRKDTGRGMSGKYKDAMRKGPRAKRAGGEGEHGDKDQVQDLRREKRVEIKGKEERKESRK